MLIEARVRGNAQKAIGDLACDLLTRRRASNLMLSSDVSPEKQDVHFLYTGKFFQMQ